MAQRTWSLFLCNLISLNAVISLKAKKSKPNRNISRIDFKNDAGEVTHGGWEVRFHRRGKKIEKFFSDNIFGSKTKALAQARVYRDEIESKLPKLNVHELSRTPSKRNQSGIVGVRRHEQTDVRGDWGYTYSFWVAQWTDENGKRRTRSFSINHYGEEEALRLAIKARKKGMFDRKRNTKSS